MDIRVVASGDIVENEGSLATRTHADALGIVEGSSYTTRDGTPIVWAFDVAYAPFAPRRLIVAGAEHTATRIYLLVPNDHAFSGMLMAKALLTGVDVDDLQHHVIASPDPDAFGELGWTEHPLQFYLCDARFGAPIATPGLAAVGLRPEEASLPADAVLTLVRARTPEGLTTLDPRRTAPWFLSFQLLIQAARRWRRLVKLDAPQVIIDNDVNAIAKHRAALTTSGWTAKAKLPDDVEAAIRLAGGE